MQINPHEATVTTATVEIRCLTINGKQVTLAVFRQLIEEDWDGIGRLWGEVNYHPERDCGDRGEHIHAVWQRGDQLRRATFYRRDHSFNPKISIFGDNGEMTTEEKLAWLAQLQERWARLSILPQLFIAV